MIIVATAFPLLVLTGIWLRIKGKPYNSLLFTAHKLISIGIIIILWLAISSVAKKQVFSNNGLIMVICSGIILIISFSSGAGQSFERDAPWAVKIIHKITAYLLPVILVITFIMIV